MTPQQPWDQQDVMSLRDFLSKQSKFLAELQTAKPKHGGETLESRALNSAKIEGAELILSRIADLSTDRPQNDVNPFVDITKD